MKKFLLAVALSALIPLSFAASADPEKDVTNSLQNYASDWNQGNLKGVIDAYEDSNATVFISADIIEGHKNIADFFTKNYTSQAMMGKMALSDIKIKMISPTYAMAIGKWKIDREQGADTKGTFTALYEKTNKGWKIVVDHASSAL